MTFAWPRPSRLTTIVLVVTMLNALVTSVIAARHLEPFADLATYYQEALNIAHGRGLSLDIKIVVNALATRPPFPVGDRPLYPLIVAGALRLFGDSLAVANVVSALAMTLTALPLYVLARKLAGNRAGVAAVLIFALNPFYHALGIGGWTDLTATFFYYSALAALVTYIDAPAGRAWRWALLAGSSAALAALAREDAVVLVTALAGAWWPAGRRRRDAVALAVPPLIAFGVRALYLWQTFGSPFHNERPYLLLPRWPLWYMLGTFTPAEYLDYVGGAGGALAVRAFNLAQVTENLFSDGIFYATQTGLMPALLLIAVVVAYRGRAGQTRTALWLFTGVVLLQFMLSIGYPGYPGHGSEIRHAQLSAPFLLMLAGAGLVVLYDAGRWRRALALALAGVYVLFAVAYTGMWAHVLAAPSYRGPSVHAAQWVSAHLPADSVLMTRSAAETRYFSGRTVIATPSAPFAELMAYARANGVTHIVLNDADRSGAPNLVQGIRAFPQNFRGVYAADNVRIVAVASYAFTAPLPPVADLYAGKTTGRPAQLIDWDQLALSGAGRIVTDMLDGWSGALAAMQNPAPAAFGPVSLDLRAGDSIVLAGYALAGNALRPGDDLRLTVNWHALAPIKPDYVVFVHVLDAAGVVRAQQDSPPLNGARPTYQWEAGERIDDAHTVGLPADLPPGRYQLEIGLYDAGTTQRLPLTDAGGARLPGDRLLVDGIEVR